MIFVIAHDNENIAVAKDYSNPNRALIGQILAEIELIKLDLLDLYEDLEETE